MRIRQELNRRFAKMTEVIYLPHARQVRNYCVMRTHHEISVSWTGFVARINTEEAGANPDFLVLMTESVPAIRV